ncbi:MAG: dicarboxylate/amino acid:cation symporter [Alloprevotella sp.]|nr:dicarboxylate/amino acid:cation symporter [Alloprevotella sp.]
MKHLSFRLPLLARILIAILLGIAFGYFSPLWFARLVATFNALFSQFLQFVVPLLIVCLITPAIGALGRNAGRLLLLTAAIAYLDTVISGLIAFGVGAWSFPALIDPQAAVVLSENVSAEPFFTLQIPPVLGVMSALVLAFMLGLCIASLGLQRLQGAFLELRAVIETVIARAVIPLLPLYIFGIFLDMASVGKAASVVSVFLGIVAIIFLLHIFVLCYEFAVAGIVTRRNPFRLLYRMLPAYFTALGTSSSAATIPVTYRCTQANGVREETAGFTVPLCATIHMSGSCLKITACAVALLIMHGQPIEPWTLVGFVFLLSIMMVAAPGVPGGSIMAALGVLQSVLGFDAEMQALMIALYIAMDSFGTACNVTGDGAIALVIDRLRPQADKSEA